MKKTLILFLTLLVATASLKAQVYLTDALKPTESYMYKAYPSKSEGLTVSRIPSKGGFSLRTGKGKILIATEHPGFVVFDLKGAYEKMTFVLGAASMYGEDANVIVTIKGDGELLFDEVLTATAAPTTFTVDVHGVHELRFDLPRGELDVAFGEVKLWKAGQTPVAPPDPMGKIGVKKQRLVERIYPYYCSGYVAMIRDKQIEYDNTVESISINRVQYRSGLQFKATQALIGHTEGCAYFWLQKKYDKLSFVVGPRDNQSSLASAWLTVKADGKIIYEKLVKQSDLAEQVVLDVKGVERIGFYSIDEGHEFNGGIVFGAVDITLYPAGDNTVPQAGYADASKEKIAALPDVCKLCSKIKPFSVRGVGAYNNTYFEGASSHYTFSMGGEKFSEGFILTTGSTLFDDNISSYVAFDLAGEYDWLSFTAGCLTQHRVLDDDIIRVYADDNLVLETTIHATWPNQHFEVPINKCRVLKFVKPGNGEQKQVYFGIGDAILYRGKPVPNNLFVHEKPECPETVDLIDLTKGPYFHFVGRYLSTLTNFDFNDCYKNGSSKKEYFQMKDGSKIYKGIMLETNIPLGFEDMTITRAVCLMFTPIYVAGIDLAVTDDKGHQSSCAAFNPYKEYETCTFTVANKSVYVDPFDETFGSKVAPPVTLYVIADQHQVAEIILTDDMKPTTFTVPINKCEQLMFWLQCGDVRSGQYVIYDITLDKKPLPSSPGVVTNIPKADQVSPKTKVKPTSGDKSENRVEKKDAQKKDKAKSEKKSRKKEKEEKEEELVEWELNKRSNSKEVNDFLAASDEVWKAMQQMKTAAQTDHKINEVFVQGNDGTVYKAVSFVDSRGSRMSISGILTKNESFTSMKRNITDCIIHAKIYLPNATLSLPNLGEKMIEFSRRIKTANKMMSQCANQADAVIAVKEMESDMINEMLDKALTVDNVASTDKVLLLPLEDWESAPEGTALQQVRYFSME